MQNLTQEIFPENRKTVTSVINLKMTVIWITLFCKKKS